jgi:hypothetical protein
MILFISSYVLQMLSTDSVKALKYKIAEQYGESLRSLRVYLNDREIKEDSKVEYLNISKLF